MEYAQHDQWQEAVQCLLAAHRPAHAEQLVRRHLAEHPQEAFAHVLLAVTLLRQKQLDEAQRSVRQGITLDPQLGDAYYLLSIILLQNHQSYGALLALAEALRRDAYNVKYLGQQAFILNLREQPQEALQAAEAGLSLDPAHAECLVQRVQALHQLRQLEAARHTVQQLLHSHPLLPVAHFLKGQEALARQDTAEAERHFWEVLRLDPEHASAKDQLLIILLRAGDYALHHADSVRARACFQKAWQLEPGNAAAHKGLNATHKNSTVRDDASSIKLWQLLLLTTLVGASAWVVGDEKPATAIPALLVLLVAWGEWTLRKLNHKRASPGSRP